MAIKTVDEKEAASPSESIARRLRALRKKLGRIEKYESLPPAELNVDQQAAIARKPELAAAVRELDEALKQIQGIEEQEAARLKETEQRHDQQLAEAAAALALAQQSAKDAAETAAVLVRTLYALNVALPLSTAAMDAATLDGLVALKVALAGPAGAAADLPAFVDIAIGHASKLASASQELFNESVSYATLSCAISDLVAPPQPPKFGVESDGQEMQDDQQLRMDDSVLGEQMPLAEPLQQLVETMQQMPLSESDGQRPAHAAPAVESEAGPVGAARSIAGISFFTPSEVLGSVSSFEVSSAIVSADAQEPSQPSAEASQPVSAPQNELQSAQDGRQKHFSYQQNYQSGRGGRGRGGFFRRGRGGAGGQRGAANANRSFNASRQGGFQNSGFAKQRPSFNPSQPGRRGPSGPAAAAAQ